MLFSCIAIRTVFHTAKPGTSIRPKIPNPPTINAVTRLLGRDIQFTELNPTKPTVTNKAPLLKCRVGRPVTEETIAEMQKMYAEGGWPITRLCKHYGVSRMMVIKKVLPVADRQAMEAQIDQRLGHLSTRAQRGWIMRHKIKQDRMNSY